MSSTNRQKAKLLLLMEMLWQDSDERHPLTTRQLMQRLAEKQVSCDRRTLSRDMADLNELGFEVMSVMIGHEKGYYTDDRKFSVPELRILMDAVQASAFIPADKSECLIEKVAALGGSYRAKLLQSNTILYNTTKHQNESIFYTIDTIEEALSEKRKVSFLYFDLDEHKNRVCRKNGKRYIVDPVGMLLCQDRYYLTALSEDRPGISTYRLVRMMDTRMERMPASAGIEEARQSVTEHTGEVFRMYAGTPEVVTLEFESSLLGDLFDHFGENIKVTKLDPDHYRARVKVQISPTFFGWILQFGNAMKLTEPSRVVQQLRNLIAQLPY